MPLLKSKKAEKKKAKPLIKSLKPPENDKSMYRADGSKKSNRGFIGQVTNNASGGTMTEFSTDMEYNGKNIGIPTMVPTLSKSEIKYMSNMKPGTGWNLSKSATERSIINKARKHAKQRLSQGKSPFYQDGEE
tara:strand:- start:84 stop:482 length:399 start_codon:yes stop_codon:yes gene_type:complete